MNCVAKPTRITLNFEKTLWIARNHSHVLNILRLGESLQDNVSQAVQPLLKQCTELFTTILLKLWPVDLTYLQM